jgi:Skp family chaperone for outer membrane proteins
MTERGQSQADAAIRAAEARAAIAKKIVSLARTVKDDADAQMVLHLAQAYAALAAEPPRTRGGAS